MEYKEKIRKSKIVADDLLGGKTKTTVNLSLQKEGFSKNEVLDVFASARKIIVEKTADSIKTRLINGEEITTISGYENLDPEIVEFLVASVKASIQKEKQIANENKPQVELPKKLSSTFIYTTLIACVILVLSQLAISERMFSQNESVFLKLLIASMFLSSIAFLYYLYKMKKSLKRSNSPNNPIIKFLSKTGYLQIISTLLFFIYIMNEGNWWNPTLITIILSVAILHGVLINRLGKHQTSFIATLKG